MAGKSQIRHNAIVDAAKQLFRTSSYDKVTTTQLAAAAGVGEATLFRYFKTKEELFAMIYGDMLDETLNEIERRDARVKAAGPGETPIEQWLVDRVFAIYFERCQFYLNNLENAGRYLRAGFARSGPTWLKNMAQQDRTIALVAGILQESNKVGEFNVYAQNCHAVYIHEVYRDGRLGFESATIWERLEPRLRLVLVTHLSSAERSHSVLVDGTE